MNLRTWYSILGYQVGEAQGNNFMRHLIPVESIEKKILLIRGQKVMIDADLAALYGVTTKALNQAVKRNLDRFPDDFMFQLDTNEKHEVVTNCDHLKRLKFSPTVPYVFTEHGAIMLASVLNSRKAIESSLYVVRAFVRLREFLSTHKDLARKLEILEQKYETHDKQIHGVFQAIRQLMSPPGKSKYKIGF